MAGANVSCHPCKPALSQQPSGTASLLQLAGSMLDEQATERLPTAATCMNV